MLSRFLSIERNFIFVIATTLTLNLLGQRSEAATFHFSQSPQAIFNFQEPYTLPDGTQGSVNLQVISIIDPQNSSGLLNLLATGFPDWSFNTAPLDAVYAIPVYEAFVPGVPSGNNSVGAQLQVVYVPGTGAPMPSTSELHWIQRVTSNHGTTSSLNLLSGLPIVTDRGHGTLEDKIDVVSDQLNPNSPFYNPFYDQFGNATETFFVDTPTRPDPAEPHTWAAELYLAEVKDPINNPKDVTIYEGLKWGWRNTVTPPPPPPPPPSPSVCDPGSNAGGSGGGGVGCTRACDRL